MGAATAPRNTANAERTKSLRIGASLLVAGHHIRVSSAGGIGMAAFNNRPGGGSSYFRVHQQVAGAALIALVGAHDFADGRFSRSMTRDVHSYQYALRDLQWSLLRLIRLIPNFDLCALFGQETYHGWNVLMSCAMHDGIAILVDRIDVATQSEHELHGFHDFGFGSGLFERRIGANSRRAQ